MLRAKPATALRSMGATVKLRVHSPRLVHKLAGERPRQPASSARVFGMETNDHPSAQWYDEVAADLRRTFRPDDEGAVCVLFADEERVVYVGMIIEPDGTNVGPLEYDGLAHIIDGIDPPAVLIAVSRSDGEPLAEDWRLWEEMRGRIAALCRCELIDLMVVGEYSWWAVAGGPPGRAA